MVIQQRRGGLVVLTILCCLTNFSTAVAQEDKSVTAATEAQVSQDKPQALQQGEINPAAESGKDNKSAYTPYISQIKDRIEEALAAQKNLARATYRFIVHIWAAPNGQIERAELQGSSGDSVTDDLIRNALTTIRPLTEVLPQGMPQPVKLRITSKNFGEEIDEKKVVRVQYIPEFLKKQLRDEIKQEVMAQAKAEGWAAPGVLPGWLERISFEGDLRLRYEMDRYPEGNSAPFNFKIFVTRNGNNVDNTSEKRNRFRVRARLASNIKINDWLNGGIRMTTGSATDPISPNQTLQTKDSKFSFALDRAFLKAKPNAWLTATGGRFANPFFATDLVWDPDLALDGAALGFTPQWSDSWSLFSTLGAFPIEEVQTSDTNKAKDKWLFGAQAGLEWKSSNQSSVKFGAALYDFKNIEGKANALILGETTYDGTVPAFRQKGNSTFDINKGGVTSCGQASNNSGCGLASKFREINLTGQVDLAMFAPVHVILTGDYVKNIGFDADEIFARTNISYAKEVKGHQVKLSVGMADTVKKGDWQVYGAYKRLGADAVVDAYTDSDFHLGGTDAKGWILGGNYGLDKNAWVSLRWLSANEISGLPLAIDVLMLDLNAKF